MNCDALFMLRPFWLLLAATFLPAHDVAHLELKNTRAEMTRYRGSPAIKLEISGAPESGDAYALVKGSRFHDGTISVDVAGAPAKGAGDGARGFIGINFRVQADGAHWENVYIRPTNGRAADQ